MAFPSTPENGNVYYTEKYVFEYNDGVWESRILSLDEINPNLGETRGAFFPPFSSVATLRTRLSCPDDKIVFSLDKVTFVDEITVEIGERFFAEWGTDILSAGQGSNYSSSVTVEYLDLSIDEEVTVNISSVDKVPDPFTFTAQTDVLGNDVIESNAIAMLGSINAPTHLWGTAGNATNAEINIASTGWQALPTSFASALKINSKDEIRLRHTTGDQPTTTYSTTVNIGYGTGVNQFESSAFDTTTFPVIYDAIVVTSPSGSDINRENAEFVSSVATGTNINHVSSDWQLATDALFTNIVQQSIGDTVNLNSWIVNGLTEDQVYYVRVRYNDVSGVQTTYATLNDLTARSFFYWRLQVRINGGSGGFARWNFSNEGDSTASGGQGYTVIESVDAYFIPPGSINRQNGASGSPGTPGSGAFGYNGGNAQAGAEYGAGGGGGAGAWSLDGTIIAGVGGGGGRTPGGRGDDRRGGNGASLTSSNGARGDSIKQSNRSENGGVSSQTGGSAGNAPFGDDRNATGGGGGGFGPGGAGQIGDDVESQAGGGGGSWNQPNGTIISGWEATASSSGSIIGGSEQLIKERAPYSSPTSWTRISAIDASGSRSIASI